MHPTCALLAVTILQSANELSEFSVSQEVWISNLAISLSKELTAVQVSDENHNEKPVRVSRISLLF